MDPTKSFDHLDPKLKETYARVMGTDTSGSKATTPSTPVPAQDPALSSSPFSPANPSLQPAADPTQTQPSTTPFGQTPTPTLATGLGPNPGTGPTINTLPADNTTMYPPPTSPAVTEPTQNAVSPPNTSFFSNPTEGTPSQVPSLNDLNTPAEPAAEAPPVTPYSPEDLGATQNAIGMEPMSQPLPSPASINQAGQHETSSLLRVLYIVGSVIFFVIYTVFWIKIFGLPIPFF